MMGLLLVVAICGSLGTFVSRFVLVKYVNCNSQTIVVVGLLEELGEHSST